MHPELSKVVKTIEKLPAARQREIAAALKELVDNPDVYVLSAEEAEDIDSAIREMDRGERVSHAEVKAIFDRYK